MQPIINIALRAARQSGEFLQKIAERHEYSQNSVTETLESIPRIEQQIYRNLLQALKKSYPDHYVAELGETELDERPVAWQVVPLTQPLAYAKGLPGNLLTLTCLRQGKAEHAILLDPMTGDEYTASKGDGATLNGRRVRAGDNAKLEAAMLSLNLLTSEKWTENPVIADLERDLIKSSYLTFSNNAPLLDLLRVCCGKLDGLVDMDIQFDQVKPGLLFCQEAGTLFGDASGAPLSNKSRSLVAANPKLFKTLIQKAHPCLQRL